MARSPVANSALEAIPEEHNVAVTENDEDKVQVAPDAPSPLSTQPLTIIGAPKDGNSRAHHDQADVLPGPIKHEAVHRLIIEQATHALVFRPAGPFISQRAG